MILCWYKNKVVGPFPTIPNDIETENIKKFIDLNLDMLPDNIDVIENAKYNDFLVLQKEE
jgi:hypothetical protein